MAQVLESETGIVVKEPQLPALGAAIARTGPDMDAPQFLEALNAAGASRPLISRLIDEYTVKETYFYRDSRELLALDWRALLENARAAGAEGLRVWVSACATGEEAFTVAILAAAALGTDAEAVIVLGTDVSQAALGRAAAATYSARAIREVPADVRERDFTSEGDRFIVRAGIRSMVRFRRHNLVTEPVPPVGEVGFDVILCRNVLIYFAPSTVERVIARLEGTLRADGSLVLGAADRLTGTALQLAHRRVPEERRRGPRRRVERGRRLRRPLGLADTREAQAPDPPRPVDPPGGPRRRVGDRVEDALLAADEGNLDTALVITEQILSSDPLQADAHFVRGLAQLGDDDFGEAVNSFRRAIYVDPGFGLAGFELGRAHEARGDLQGARRAYARALRMLDTPGDGHEVILDYIDLADVAVAARARLRALES